MLRVICCVSDSAIGFRAAVLIIEWIHFPCSDSEPYAMLKQKTVKALTFRRAASRITLFALLVAKSGVSDHDDVSMAEKMFGHLLRIDMNAVLASPVDDAC